MTHRKHTISIHDYPEHLNPFREAADDRVSTTGRRRSSFRVNSWNVFSPKKGKSKAFEDTNSVSSSATSLFLSWTPKILRKASFLRSSPGRSSIGPSEIKRLDISRFSFQSKATQRTLPPASSRSSLQPTSSRTEPHSNSSRSTLLPKDNAYTFSSSRPTSSPGRPTPSNVRTSLSPGKSLSPAPLTLAVTPSTESAPNGLNTGSQQTMPVSAVRKVLFPASPKENTVGEQPSQEEAHYSKQGAKPKKKRRAPVPPVSPSDKSTSDIGQFNPTESDVSVTSSVTASSPEDSQPREEIAAVSSQLEVLTQEAQFDAKNRESHDPWIRNSDQSDGKQIPDSGHRTSQLRSENKTDQSKDTEKDPQDLESNCLNGHSGGEDEMPDRLHSVVRIHKPITVEDVSEKQADREEFRGPSSTDGNLELQIAPEDEPQENQKQLEDGKLSCQQDRGTDITKCRSNSDDGVGDIKTDTAKNTHTLHLEKNFVSENVGLQNGEGLDIRDIQEIEKHEKPEPKPRTALPNA